MLSTTQSTLKGRSPESTPQILAGKGSLILALWRRSNARGPKSVASPLAMSPSICRSSVLSDWSFCVIGDCHRLILPPFNLVFGETIILLHDYDNGVQCLFFWQDPAMATEHRECFRKFLFHLSFSCLLRSSQSSVDCRLL